MKYESLIFDLDGTISDPKTGIVRSLNYALESHGFSVRDEDELATYIGPPLDLTFSDLISEPNSEIITSLVEKFRERYSAVGYSENVLYDGIRDVLRQLRKKPGITLGICTSKRVDYAERILKMFGLRELFDFVNGGDVGIEKWQQLTSLHNDGAINKKAIMIGDRYVDLTAAHRNGLQSAGVLWGYGSKAELELHKPAYIFTRPRELSGLVA